MVEPTRMVIDAAISYHATVLIQILVNIAIGDVNGIIDRIVASVEFGSDTTDIDITKPKIIGTITTLCSWLAS
jgi:hypothetical protein